MGYNDHKLWVGIVLGRPGSGKGTVAKKLASVLGIHYASTGDYCRQIAREDSNAGREIRKSGTIKNVPEHLIWPWVEAQMREHSQLMLDGAPRNALQFIRYLKLLQETGHVAEVVELPVSRQEAIDRMVRRQREGETLENIEARQDQFEAETQMVIDFFKQSKLACDRRIAEYHEIDGHKTIPEVFIESLHLIGYVRDAVVTRTGSSLVIARS